MEVVRFAYINAYILGSLAFLPQKTLIRMNNKHHDAIRNVRERQKLDGTLDDSVPETAPSVVITTMWISLVSYFEIRAQPNWEPIRSKQLLLVDAQLHRLI